MHGGLLIKEFMLPDLFLRLPVHKVTFLDWSSEYDVAEILATLKLRADVDFFLAIAGHTIRDATWFVGRSR